MAEDGRAHERECLLSARKLEELVRERYQRPLPRRFYREVSVEQADGGLAVLLDGRPLRTPLKRPLLLPTRALADAVAAEWCAQGARIDPAAMPMTGLANAAIDKADVHAPENERAALLSHVRELAEHDMLCYRAGPSQPGLAERQRQEWDPLLDWAAEALAARLHLAQGIMPLMQPLAAVAAIVRPYEDAAPFVFVPLFAMATLTRSVILPLAVWHGRIAPAAAWEASVLEERWNMELWGADAQAARRLQHQRDEFLAAVRFLSLASAA